MSPKAAEPLVARRDFLRRAALAAGALALAPRRGRAAPTAPDEAGLRGLDPNLLGPYRLGPELHRNALRSPADVKGFRVEGQAEVGFPAGRLRLASRLDSSLGQKSNFVVWFDRQLPANFAAFWDFRVIRDPGLCIVFFAARSRAGGDIFGPGLAPRTGEYSQYHHGDIDTLHLSYFRRSKPAERAMHLCNLRKSYGFHLVAEGADPLPGAAEARPPYRIGLVKLGPEVAFFIDRLPILSWRDDGRTYGPALGAGRFGLRQMAPLVAEYENFVVRDVARAVPKP